MQEHVPPHSMEAEQALLGSLIFNLEDLSEITDLINAEDFYNINHQLIFKAILQIQETQIDLISVSDYLEKQNKLETIGGLDYLVSLKFAQINSKNLSTSISIIKKNSLHRKLLKAGEKISNSVRNSNNQTEEQLLDSAENVIFSLSELNKTSGPEYIKSILVKALDRLQYKNENPGIAEGLMTGFKRLDEITYGLHPGSLIILAARPSVGKTALALNIAANVAVSQKKRVLIFSMEMTNDELCDRLLSSLGGIPGRSLQRGDLTDGGYSRLTAASAMLQNSKMCIDDTSSLTVNEIRSRARKVSLQFGGLDLIIIDYLQLMHGSNKTENRVQEVAEISRSLKSISKEFNVPVLALSQLNRELEKRINKRPIMSDIRDSGSIEQDADVIMFLHREENSDEVEVIIAKHRRGPVGTIRLFFNNDCTKFSDPLN